MPNETEAKYRVADFEFEKIRRTLKSLGAEYIGTVLQTDLFFDTPSGKFRKTDRCMRLREMKVLNSGKGKADAAPLLTFKGPRGKNARAKVRMEIQTRVDDPKALAEILQLCGMEHAATIQKKRASYILGRCRIELDELPHIGKFVEIEAPTIRAISTTAKKLLLEPKPITESYSQMLAEYCKEHKIPSDEIIFST